MSLTYIDIDARFCPAIFELEITRAAIYRSNLLVESGGGGGVLTRAHTHTHTRACTAIVEANRKFRFVRSLYTRPTFQKRCRLVARVFAVRTDWTVIFPSCLPPPDRNEARLTRDWIEENRGEKRRGKYCFLILCPSVGRLFGPEMNN